LPAEYAASFGSCCKRVILTICKKNLPVQHQR